MVVAETQSHTCRSHKEQAFIKIRNAVKEIESTASINEECPSELKNMAHKLVHKDLTNGRLALRTQGRVSIKPPYSTVGDGNIIGNEHFY